MKVADYYRHRLDLFTSGEVHFSSKDELLDFLSLYLKASYASYLSNVYFYAVNIAEQNDASQRKESEPSLVALYVKDFLLTQLPDTSTLTYKIMRRFKPVPVYKIDTHTNTQLFEEVLKRLGRTGDATVAEAFPSQRLISGANDEFEIEGDLILRMSCGCF